MESVIKQKFVSSILAKHQLRPFFAILYHIEAHLVESLLHQDWDFIYDTIHNMAHILVNFPTRKQSLRVAIISSKNLFSNQCKINCLNKTNFAIVNLPPSPLGYTRGL